MVAGPIVLYNEMMPQFMDERRRKFNGDNFAKGIYIFVVGLFKKIVIADTIALFVNNGFVAEQLSVASAWVTMLSYTLQIYFGFSGYSDMAIGLGKMFNIEIPLNFESPYKSKSITEFWRRWHITLGRALSTYVYIPLGGNRKGKVRTYINLFVTFFVSGLWHGASWTFVLWGVLHGCFVVIERMFQNTLAKIPNIVRTIITFLIVNLLWVLFRAETFGQAAMVYRGLINIKEFGLASVARLTLDGIFDFPVMVAVAYVFIVLLVLMIIVFMCRNSVEKVKTLIFNRKTLIFTSLLFIISVVHLSRLSVFIYFNF